jgi:preprotein translocase subunit SecE
MNNRAVRRQQTKEKEKPTKASRAMPRAGATPRTAKGTAAPQRRGVAPRFAMDIISELRKVIWPKREDVVNLTIVVVICTVLIGTFLGLIDIGFGRLIDDTLLSR